LVAWRPYDCAVRWHLNLASCTYLPLLRYIEILRLSSETYELVTVSYVELFISKREKKDLSLSLIFSSYREKAQVFRCHSRWYIPCCELIHSTPLEASLKLVFSLNAFILWTQIFLILSLRHSDEGKRYSYFMRVLNSRSMASVLQYCVRQPFALRQHRTLSLLPAV
jgi:hypothetical protein